MISALCLKLAKSLPSKVASSGRDRHIVRRDPCGEYAENLTGTDGREKQELIEILVRAL